jgi:hypothetical protein
MALVVRDDPPAASAPASAPAPAAIPVLSPGPVFTLLAQVVHVRVDMQGSGALCGTVQLKLELPSPEATEVRLHCAPTCSIQRIFVDSVPLAAPLPTPATAADDLAESVVPNMWRHTRDLPSFQRCHGAATFVGSYQLWDDATSGRSFHGGQLAIPLPAAADTASGSDARTVTVQVEYVVSEPRGGIHFVRARPGNKVVYAHTISEAGAPRRWMPCIDCVQVRCPTTLHVTAAPDMRVYAAGRPLVGEEGGGCSGVARSTRTHSFAFDSPVTATQLGFIVGRHLSAIPHPTLPRVTLVLGTLQEAAGGTPQITGGSSAAGSPPRRARRWQEMLYLSRHLPALFNILRAELLGPAAAVKEEEVLAAEDSAREEPSDAAAAAAEAATTAAGTAASSSSDPFPHQTIAVLEGAFEESAAFAGLVILSVRLSPTPFTSSCSRPHLCRSDEPLTCLPSFFACARARAYGIRRRTFSMRQT